jgi:hypothetical protein
MTTELKKYHQEHKKILEDFKAQRMEQKEIENEFKPVTKIILFSCIIIFFFVILFMT